MCTIIQMPHREGYLIVNNYDTFYKNGMLFTNNRGIQKKALVLPPNLPVKWTSIYGSISFSQSGKEMSVGGINEMGLMVGQTTLPETVYPNLSDQPSIKEIQLVQYLLDICSSVKEAVIHIEKVNIAQADSRIQYAICDKWGDMAIIEYLNGKPNVYTCKALPIRAITNSTYRESLEAIDNGISVIHEGNDYKKNSLKRFIKAAEIDKKGSLVTIDEAFALLKEVERYDTVWSIIYDTFHPSIYFKVIGISSVRHIELNDVNFERNAQPMYYDLFKDAEGKIMMEPYSVSINRKLINSFFEDEKIKSLMNLSTVPMELIDYLSIYPDFLYGSGN
jgi:penicillin V acylase-like amidase (Ntn superfamily)